MAKQSTKMPTNKLTVGASLAGLFGVYTAPVVQEVWPQIAPVVIAGPTVTEAVSAGVSILAGVAVAWFVADAPNVQA